MSARVGSNRPVETDRIQEGRRALRYSWASVAIVPVAFVAAMVLGDWLITLQGYASGTEELLPLSVVALAGTPALLVMVAPTIPAVLFSRKAVRLGVANARTPGVIGATVGVAAVALNLLALVAARIL